MPLTVSEPGPLTTPDRVVMPVLLIKFRLVLFSRAVGPDSVKLLLPRILTVAPAALMNWIGLVSVTAVLARMDPPTKLIVPVPRGLLLLMISVPAVRLVPPL